MSLDIEGMSIDIDASDIPNNPVQKLIDALDAVTQGHAASVWWHLEPDGYFLHFEPIRDRIRLRIDFAPASQTARATAVAATEGDPREILHPFCRFLHAFQSGDHQSPHWPEVDFRALGGIAERIQHARADSAHPFQQENP